MHFRGGGKALIHIGENSLKSTSWKRFMRTSHFVAALYILQVLKDHLGERSHKFKFNNINSNLKDIWC